MLRGSAGALLLRRSTRYMSLLGSIFGIGEFEVARNSSLNRSTRKEQAYKLALLDVGGSASGASWDISDVLIQWQYVSMNSHPKFMLQQILEDETPFLMGHVLVGASQCLAPLMHQDTLDAASRLHTANEIAQKAKQTTASERMHVLALNAMIFGRQSEAATIYETILQNDYTDLLALRCCYDIYRLIGDSKNMLATIRRRLPFWSPSDTGYSFLIGMQAYGLKAVGQLDAAEALAEKALSLNGNDRWALHTVLHVLEARGNANHGASYANQYKARFDNGGPLESHLYYQWALYMLDLGHYERIEKMLEVYIFPSQPITSPHAVPTLCDATQLYWRLRFAGQDTIELGKQLLQNWSAILSINATPKYSSPLAKILQYSILTCVNRVAAPPMNLLTAEPAVDIDSLKAKLDVTPFQFSYSPLSGDLERVYTSICRSFQAFSEERYEEASLFLLPVRGNLSCLGGTDVDLDLIEQLLIECASKCDDLRLAKLLLNERISARPQSAQCWKTLSRLSETMGDTSAVRDAQGMSYVLGLGQGGNRTY